MLVVWLTLTASLPHCLETSGGKSMTTPLSFHCLLSLGPLLPLSSGREGGLNPPYLDFMKSAENWSLSPALGGQQALTSLGLPRLIWGKSAGGLCSHRLMFHHSFMIR